MIGDDRVYEVYQGKGDNGYPSWRLVVLESREDIDTRVPPSSGANPSSQLLGSLTQALESRGLPVPGVWITVALQRGPNPKGLIA